MIKVLHPGIYSSVQDKGRVGFSKYGVPVGGVMDGYSHEIGNILIKNSKNEASIEIAFGSAKLLFDADTFICITGADFSPTINNDSVEMYTVLEVKKGSILSFGRRKFGVRTYVAVQGGIQSEEVLKSKSYFPSVTSKSLLEKGDVLTIHSKKPYKNRGFSKIKRLDQLFDDTQLECFPGPEYDLLSANQKQILQNEFTISKDNNRVGYRLEELIENNLKPILTSAVLPGTMQLSPSGKLIVLMKDCQVTGGYPRVLQLSSFAISQLSQKTTGDKIQFLVK